MCPAVLAALSLGNPDELVERLRDPDVQVYVDRLYLKRKDAVAQYVDREFSLDVSRPVQNPLFYWNDILIEKYPTKRMGLTLVHEAFHAVFDLHDEELSRRGVEDDEAVTWYFERVVAELTRLVAVEKEIARTGTRRGCSPARRDEHLATFARELSDVVNGVTGDYGAISPAALALVEEVVGFAVPIDAIVAAYKNGACGACR